MSSWWPFPLLALLGAPQAAAIGAGPPMPPPFDRVLRASTPVMTGGDVFVARELLVRNHGNGATLAGCADPPSCSFDGAMVAAVAAFQHSRPALAGDAPGIVGPSTAAAMLNELQFDRYTRSDTTPESLGYRYMIAIQAHRNRSIEDHAAQLLSGNGTVLLQFTVRVHGAISDPPPTWPNFNNSGSGRNEFSNDGDTPTGLFELDLNSPEDDPVSFGKWPVNRAVRGLEGNAKMLVSGAVGGIRSGILVHTGEWVNYGWKEPSPMPNSNGCVHAWPESIQAIAELLAAEGIQPVPNTNGKIPYPYKPRGLLSVELVDPPFPTTAVIPRPYTLFKQCDAPWGQDVINTKTVCAVGCLMSSVSMAINTNGITIPAPSPGPGPGGAAVAATPGSLNAWLRANHGYDGKDDLEEAAVPAISPSHIFWNATNSSHRQPDLTMAQVRGMLRLHQPVIANVLKGRHFVLVVGWDSDDDETLYINDSGFMRQSYNFSDVVGWRLFRMLPRMQSQSQSQ